MRRYSIERQLLGSTIKAVVIASAAAEASAQKALEACMAECARIETAFSRFLPESELSLLNKRLGEPVPISDELFLLIGFAEEMKQATAGAFDITVNSILEGWGYDRGYSLTPKTAGRLGTVELLPESQVRLSAPIDLGGIGKGYALDRMRKLLDGFSDIMLDAGGDLYARGKNELGEGWKIVFEHPTDTTMAIGEVMVDDLYLAASSPSRRHWRHFHHLVDPAAAAPAQLTAMTYVQAKKGIIADALATALFVLGPPKAMKLLPSLPAEAMLIDPAGRIVRTPGFVGTLYAA